MPLLSDMLINKGVLFFSVFVFSLVATEIARRLCQKTGFVSKPMGDRWNPRTVALGGGSAIFLSLLFGAVWIEDPQLLRGLLPAVTGVFLMGLYDDLCGMTPLRKLFVETLMATLVVSQGFMLPLEYPIFAMPLTIVWIVGMTNAVNIIDNMDGLSSGVITTLALGFAYLFTKQGNLPMAIFSVVVAASAAGFLVHNFHPARIFMGDAGSLPLGFLLATLATELRFTSQVSQGLTLLPILFLFIVPVFDLTLVMISRRSASRPVMTGGRDHTSHRLVNMGLSETRAVWMLYLFGGCGFAASAFMFDSSIWNLVALSSASLVVLVLAAMFLLDLVVYPIESKEEMEELKGTLFGPQYLPLTLQYVVEIGVDIFVISLVWMLAHYIRFYESGHFSTYELLSVLPLLPYVIMVKLTSMAFYRLYRGIWRSVESQDIYQIFKANTLGSVVLSLGFVFFLRLQDISRIVLILDWLICFLSLLGVRAALSGFRRWSRRLASQPLKVAYVGSPLLESYVEKAVSQSRGLLYTGMFQAGQGEGAQESMTLAESLEHFVRSHQIDLIYVDSQEHVSTLRSIAGKGLVIRPLKIQLG